MDPKLKKILERRNQIIETKEVTTAFQNTEVRPKSETSTTPLNEGLASKLSRRSVLSSSSELSSAFKELEEKMTSPRGQADKGTLAKQLQKRSTLVETNQASAAFVSLEKGLVLTKGEDSKQSEALVEKMREMERKGRERRATERQARKEEENLLVKEIARIRATAKKVLPVAPGTPQREPIPQSKGLFDNTNAEEAKPGDLAQPGDPLAQPGDPLAQPGDLLTQAVEILATTDVAEREKTFVAVCEALSKTTLPKTELEDSISVCCQQQEPSSAAILEALAEVGTQTQFLEATPLQDVMDVNKNIENLTGYNPLTKEESTIIQLKVEAEVLESINIVAKDVKKVTEALLKDLADHYKVREEEIRVRLVTHGSVDIKFSLPPSLLEKTALPASLPAFSELLKAEFPDKPMTMKEIKVQAEKLQPDIKKAMELLKEYTSPAVINLDDKASGSEIITKFSKYLPALAALSSNVKIVQKEGNLEIYGPAEERGKILYYFAEMENALRGVSTKEISIALDQGPPKNRNYPRLWRCLYGKAKDFVKTNYNGKHTLNFETLTMNHELEKGCPVAISFLSALEKMKLDPENPEEVCASGTFGWHGTRTSDNVSAIAHHNLDPQRRSGQVYGPGEYCAINASYSQGCYWGDTNTLFLFFIITKNCEYYKLSTHHVMNNPGKSEMYMVPILLATFNNAPPITIKCDCKPLPVNNELDINWEWQDDKGWVKYGVGQKADTNVQAVVEECYDNFMRRTGASCLLLSFTRLRDNKVDKYLIDFKAKKQINQRTNYERAIRRVAVFKKK